MCENGKVRLHICSRTHYNTNLIISDCFRLRPVKIKTRKSVIFELSCKHELLERAYLDWKAYQATEHNSKVKRYQSTMYWPWKLFIRSSYDCQGADQTWKVPRANCDFLFFLFAYGMSGRVEGFEWMRDRSKADSEYNTFTNFRLNSYDLAEVILKRSCPGNFGPPCRKRR